MYKVIAYAPGQVGLVSKNLKRVAVKPVEAVFGAKPQKAIFILQAADNRVVGEAILHLVVPEVVGLRAKAAAQREGNGKYKVFYGQENDINGTVITGGEGIKLLLGEAQKCAAAAAKMRN